MEDLFVKEERKLPISPFKEMAAYEALWTNSDLTFKKISELFSSKKASRPSELIDEHFVTIATKKLKNILGQKDAIKPGVLISGTFDYPEQLRDAKHPIEMLYFSGNLKYLSSHCGVAVVGSRKPSQSGIKRTQKLVQCLVNDNVTIFSGLAEGIDTAAHKTTLEMNGRTVAVIGTPLNQFYPKQNKDLQLKIASEHLLISQVPYLKYSNQDYRWNRVFFPERNKTMSALSNATVIVEAGETSGSLIQAKAALEQGRKLFILQNCFENPSITWPKKFEQMGAIRVREYDDIKQALNIK